jgi:hypothetical protein
MRAIDDDMLTHGRAAAVVVGCDAAMIAHHDRSYARKNVPREPLHHLPLPDLKLGRWTTEQRPAPQAPVTCRPGQRPSFQCPPMALSI